MPAAHVDTGNRCVRANVGAVGDGRVAECPRHSAHAAGGKTPRAELAVADVTDLVVRHHVRGARGARPGPRADHAADRQHALHLRRLEVFVEEIGDAHREQAGDVGHPPHAQAPNVPRQLELFHQVARPHRTDLRGDRHEHRSQHVGHAGQPRVPRWHRVGVALGERRDAVVVLLRVVGVQQDRRAVREGLVVRPHREDLVAVPLQREVGQDARGHQAHHVRVRGDLDVGVIGERGAGVGGPTRLGPGLQAHGARAGPGEVRRGDQPVVPAPHHNRVVRVRVPHRSGSQLPAEL